MPAAHELLAVAGLELGRATDVATVTAEHGMRVALIVTTIVVLAVTGAALVLGWEGALTRRRNPVTVDAYVAGDRTPLSSHLSGYVRNVLVRDNQSVRAGDTIVQMVDDDYRAMAAEAHAQADAAVRHRGTGRNARCCSSGGAGARHRDGGAAQLVHAVNEAHARKSAAHSVGALQSRRRAGLPAAGAKQHERRRRRGYVNQRRRFAGRANPASEGSDEADAQSTLAQIAWATRIVSLIDGTLGVRVHEGRCCRPEPRSTP